MNDDRRLVLFAITGDNDAFAELVRRHQTYLIGILRRTCGDSARAEDIAQAAFIKAWRSLATLHDATAFRPWLRRIALNLAIDLSRRERSTAGLPVEVVRSDDAGSDALARMDVAAAIDRLSIAQRACIVLSFGEGMSHIEIANELVLPLGTVKSHIARGLASMRRTLTNKEQAL